jgi:hypothetical protein
MNHHSLRGGATRVSNNVKDFNIFLLFSSAINLHYTMSCAVQTIAL